MPWAEAYNSRGSATFDSSNGRATLTYHVTLTAPNQNPLLEAGAPANGSPHPVYSSLFLNSLAVVRTIVSGTQTIYEVQGTFASDSTGLIVVQPQELKKTYKYKSGSTRTKIIQAPAFREIKVPSVDSSGASVFLSRFEQFTIPLESKISRKEVRVSVPSLSASDIDLVEGQLNKFHQINGKWHKFTDFQYDNNDPAKFDCVYTWEYDNGNEGLGNGTYTTPGGSGPGVVYPPPRTTFGAYIPKAPSTPLDANGGANPPIIIVVQGYTDADKGSAGSFPGNPLA